MLILRIGQFMDWALVWTVKWHTSVVEEENNKLQFNSNQRTGGRTIHFIYYKTIKKKTKTKT